MRTLILATAFALAACASSPDGTPLTEKQKLVYAYQVACGAYSQAKAPLDVAVQMGAIDVAGQAALRESMAGADQLCSSPVPPDNIPAAITMVTRAAAAVMLAVGQDTGKLPGARS